MRLDYMVRSDIWRNQELKKVCEMRLRPSFIPAHRIFRETLLQVGVG